MRETRKRKPVVEPIEKPLDPVGETPAKYLRGDPQAIVRNPGKGAVQYSDKNLRDYLVQPIGKQGVSTRNKWAETAYVLALRAKRASQSYSKKDFNALYRLVLSAGIAFDKAFPLTPQPLGGNLVIQLFGSLGSDTAKAILEPKHPMIDITPIPLVDTTTDEVPSSEPLDDIK